MHRAVYQSSHSSILRAAMGAISIALVIVLVLQLTFPSEAAEGLTTGKLPPPKLNGTCPANGKLAAIKKALGLKFNDSSRRKRALSFPIECLHVAVIQDASNNYFFHNDLYECCNTCHFPHYVACQWAGNPDWVCASEAYKCVCNCRNTHIPATSTKSVTIAAGKLPSPKSKTNICIKQRCPRRKSCCLENVCIRLFVNKKSTPIRKTSYTSGRN